MPKLELINLATRAAKAAGAEILRYYNSDELEISQKSDNSPVTNADISANDAITFYLQNSGIPICSEESLLDVSKMGENDTFWLVDPLDGTKDFLAKNGEFSVCIALIENARPTLGVIYIPLSGELFYTSTLFQTHDNLGLIQPEKAVNSVISGNSSHTPSVDKLAEHFGLDRLHCGSAIKFCRIAQGLAAFYPRFCSSSLWDIAAGDAIVKASGGGVFGIESGAELSYTGANLTNEHFVAFSKAAMPYKDDVLSYARTLLG